MNWSCKSPKIDAKHFHYANDGTGRDTYVSINNGGLLSPKLVSQLEVSPKATYTPMIFPKNSQRSQRQTRIKLQSCHMKVNHYYGDGKGRDYFVTVNDGGQSQPHDWKSHVDQLFPASLRQYSQQWLPRPTFDLQNEKLRLDTRARTKKQNSLSRQLSSPKASLFPDYKLTTNYKSYQEPEFQTKSKMNYLI